MEERFFGLHHDLPPEAIARELGGELVWKKEDQGQWIALIRFNRQFEARLGILNRTMALHSMDEAQAALEPAFAAQHLNPRAPVKPGASILHSK